MLPETHTKSKYISMKKRRHEDDESFKDKIFQIENTSANFNSCMEDIEEIAAELTSTMSHITSATLETNQAVEANMDALKKMDRNGSKLIESMNHSLSNIDRMEDEISSSSSLMDDLEKIVKDTADKADTETKAVLQLEEEAKKIEEVVALVKNIADETNLLALNAAIEASRAGEHGKGFAVVADEVRSLAEFSENTTYQINSSIEKSLKYLKSVIHGVSNFQDSADTNSRKSIFIASKFDELSKIILESKKMLNKVALQGEEVKKISALSMKEGEEIASATEEISASTEETSQSTTEETSAIKSIGSESDQFLATVNEIKNDEDADQENFKDTIKNYVNNISAAVEEVNSSSMEIKRAIEEIAGGGNLIDSSLSKMVNHVGEIKELNSQSMKNMENVINKTDTLLDVLEDIKALDHLIYIDNLKRAIETKSHFKGQLDPTKCAFGTWYGAYRPHGEKEEALYKSIKNPHDAVHNGAAKIVKLMKDGNYDGAWAIYNNEVEPATKQFKKCFKGWGMKEGIEFIITGIERGRALNDHILERIVDLQKSFNDIFKVIEIISTVTIQINMLAVNGAIEAARAGEYGKGFAVVAGDIRNMAKESETNSNRIKDMIEFIGMRIEEILSGFENIGKLIIKQNDRARATVENMVRVVRLVDSTLETIDEASANQHEMADAVDVVIKNNDKIKEKLKIVLDSQTKASDAISRQLQGLEKGMSFTSDLVLLSEDIDE